MRPNHSVILLAFVLAFVIALSVPSLGLGVKYKASGTFVDGAGGQHPWNINDAHTLLWDSNPYIPVGGVFTAQYLAPGAGDDAYQTDIKALDALKSKGITDVVLRSTGPITSADPASLQKIITYLDTNGFTYGVEMDDGPKAALQGYLISPNRYRLEGPNDKTTIVCDWPDVDSAIYVLVSKLDNTIKANGGAIVRDGKVSIFLPEPLRSGDILIVYPHKTLKTGAGVGDLWSGFGEYRDRVLAFFKGVKFGPGFRFFLEPFTCKMDFTGEMLGFLPDSSGFRLGFEAYLTRKYKTEGGINATWGLNENLDSIEQAARLMPMWTSGRGVAYAYDRASAHLYPVNPAISQQTWRDIVDYRDTSAQEYMNTIADALKKQVANVPVIFKSTTYSRIYNNPFGMGGFDGLGAQAYGTGESPVDSIVGSSYALAEESGKSTWFIADAQSGPGGSYSNENVMASTLDSLREIGCKGFFVEDLLKDPMQADCLKSFKAKIDKSWTDQKPEVIYYPTDPSTGAYVKRLASNTWWLPTLRKGNTTFIGDGLSAYTILGEGRVYIWSGSGDRTVTLVSPTGSPSVEFPAGTKLTAIKKTSTYSLPLTGSPVVLRGLNFDQAFPKETAQIELDRLQAIIPEADKAGLEVKKARGALESAKTVLQNGQPLISYGITRESLVDLLNGLGSDVWVEGEGSIAYNFGMSAAAPGASGSLALILDSTEDAPLVPYHATFRFDTQSNSSYEIWVAGTPPADGSPMSYSLDEGNWAQVSPVDSKTTNYAPGLAWYKIGTANIFPGTHTLTFRIDGKRTSDNKYYFALDAIVLSPRGFKPNGVIRPF